MELALGEGERALQVALSKATSRLSQKSMEIELGQRTESETRREAGTCWTALGGDGRCPLRAIRMGRLGYASLRVEDHRRLLSHR